MNHEPDPTLAVTKTCPKDGVHLFLITLDVLEAMGTGGKYIGTIAEVMVETVNNKKKGRRMKVPHIYFEDAHFLIPNEGAKKTLIAGYGPETDG